jgi:hypothetical protein
MTRKEKEEDEGEGDKRTIVLHVVRTGPSNDLVLKGFRMQSSTP